WAPRFSDPANTDRQTLIAAVSVAFLGLIRGQAPCEGAWARLGSADLKSEAFSQCAICLLRRMVGPGPPPRWSMEPGRLADIGESERGSHERNNRRHSNHRLGILVARRASRAARNG